MWLKPEAKTTEPEWPRDCNEAETPGCAEDKAETARPKQARDLKDKKESTKDPPGTDKSNPSLPRPQAGAVGPAQLEARKDAGDPQAAIFKAGTEGPKQARLCESSRRPSVPKLGTDGRKPRRAMEKVGEIDPTRVKLRTNTAEACSASP